MSGTQRKMVAIGAAALMVAAGQTVVAPSAVAQADTSQCETSQTAERSWAGSFGTKYYLNKEVVGDGTAAPGGEVTFRTTISGAGALVSRLDDFHPEGFELVRARESVWKVIGGQSWTTVTDDVLRDSSANSIYRTGAGWTTAGGAHATLETTYKVPDTVSPGDVLNTGAGVTTALANGRWVENPIDTCVTIRDPNPGEQLTGSLDDLGFGSATEGSTTSSGISSDPSGFISDIINGINIGELIGLS